MAKLPVNLKAIITADNLPDGRYRARITKPGVYPKDAVLGERGEIPGVFNDEGKQKYGWLRAGFRFTEHPSNYVPGADGNAQSLVGETFWANISLVMTRTLIDLYKNAGVDSDAEDALEQLDGKEIDIVVKQKERKDTGAIEPNLVGTRVAVG